MDRKGLHGVADSGVFCFLFDLMDSQEGSSNSCVVFSSNVH